MEIIHYNLLAFKNIEMIVFYIVRILTEAERVWGMMNIDMIWDIRLSI